jgi:hypothetical protein
MLLVSRRDGLGRFSFQPAMADLAVAGFALGLAAAVKFSGLALFPIFVVLYLIKWCQASRPDSGAMPRPRLSIGHLALSLALIGGSPWL